MERKTVDLDPESLDLLLSLEELAPVPGEGWGRDASIQQTARTTWTATGPRIRANVL
jgi:hypothetical protein